MRNVIDFDVDRDEVSMLCEIADSSCAESCINFISSAASLVVCFERDGETTETTLSVANGSACYMLPDDVMRAAGEFTVCTVGKTAMRFVVAEAIPEESEYYLSLSGGIFYVNVSFTSSGGNAGSGQDGYSPTVAMTETTDGVQIAITDVNGTKTATVKHGERGETGPAGADGFSPTITLTRLSNGVQITVVDKNGTQTAIVYDGVGGGGSDSEETTYTFYIDGNGHLICSYTTDDAPPFSIVDGHLIYTYADGTTAPLLEINESGHLILTTEG